MEKEFSVKRIKIRLRICFSLFCLMLLLNFGMVGELFWGASGQERSREAGLLLLLCPFALIVLPAGIIVIFCRWIYPSFINLERNVRSELFREMKEREYSAMIMKKQAELNALQSQINPHFLYNTLETIRGQALSYGVRDIAEMTKALADMFRYSISQNGSIIELREELDNVDSYLKIQRIRFHDKFKLIQSIDEDTRTIKIPKLLIQPLVENALKHGLELKRERGTIEIEAYRTGERLIITIKDDGIGMDLEKLKALNRKLAKPVPCGLEPEEQQKSIGLVNINERIKMVYGMEYGLHIMSAKGVGTTVELTLGVLPEAPERNGVQTLKKQEGPGIIGGRM